MDISKLLTKSRPISVRFVFKQINNRKYKMSLNAAVMLNENLHFVQQLNTHYPPYTKENSSPPYTFAPPLTTETQ